MAGGQPIRAEPEWTHARLKLAVRRIFSALYAEKVRVLTSRPHLEATPEIPAGQKLIRRTRKIRKAHSVHILAFLLPTSYHCCDENLV
jgi:hypothetical protein